MELPGPDSDVSVGRDPAPGVGLWIAVVVSYVVNPLVLPPAVYGLVLGHVGAPGGEIATGVGIAAFFLAVVPLVHVGWMRWQGRVASLEIRDRRKRTEPFLGVLAAGGAALGAIVLVQDVGRGLLMALVGCHLLNTGLLFLITTQWKISVHCASVAGALGTLVYARMHVPGTLLRTGAVAEAVLLAGAVLVPLLLWARVRSRAHTLGQATAGTVMGLVAPYAELYVIGAGMAA